MLASRFAVISALPYTQKLGDWGTTPLRASQPTVSDDIKTTQTGAAQVNSISEPAAVACQATIVADGAEPATPVDAVEFDGASPAHESNGIQIEVGFPIDAFNPKLRTLNIGDTNLNQLNIGVVGDLGTGKTQLLKSLVYQITRQKQDNRGVAPNILILDYKRDYSAEDFVQATNARVIKPQNLPLNLFDLSQAADSMTPWLDRFNFFADVLDKVYSGIGPVQRQLLKSAVRSVYQDRSQSNPPTIYDVHAAYQLATNGRADSISAIIEEMVDRELFSRDATKGSTRDFLKGVVVISLDAITASGSTASSEP